jgi:hypothetical protein
MIKLKSADRIKVKTGLGTREVKGELYRGFGINKDYYELNNNWLLTVTEGDKKGWAIAACRKKNDCRLLANEIIKKLGRVDIINSDIDDIKGIVKKYMVKENK